MLSKTLITAFVLLFYSAKSSSQSRFEEMGAGEYPIDSLCYNSICSPKRVPQYYSLGAKNYKSSYQILNEWLVFFKKPSDFNQSGFLTIRFIVNCKSEPCCFYFYEMNEKYEETPFQESVKMQLTAFVKQLDGWKQVENNKNPANYRYYLNFVIKNGSFQSVSP